MIEEKIKNTRGVRLRGFKKRKERKECLQEVRNTKANMGSLLIMFEMKGKDEMVNGQLDREEKRVREGWSEKKFRLGDVLKI
nr:hypothetical protein [Tanacetum cinerariifolium]